MSLRSSVDKILYSFDIVIHIANIQDDVTFKELQFRSGRQDHVSHAIDPDDGRTGVRPELYFSDGLADEMAPFVHLGFQWSDPVHVAHDGGLVDHGIQLFQHLEVDFFLFFIERSDLLTQKQQLVALTEIVDVAFSGFFVSHYDSFTFLRTHYSLFFEQTDCPANGLTGNGVFPGQGRTSFDDIPFFKFFLPNTIGDIHGNLFIP